MPRCLAAAPPGEKGPNGLLGGAAEPRGVADRLFQPIGPGQMEKQAVIAVVRIASAPSPSPARAIAGTPRLAARRPTPATVLPEAV